MGENFKQKLMKYEIYVINMNGEVDRHYSDIEKEVVTKIFTFCQSNNLLCELFQIKVISVVFFLWLVIYIIKKKLLYEHMVRNLMILLKNSSINKN